MSKGKYADRASAARARDDALGELESLRRENLRTVADLTREIAERDRLLGLARAENTELREAVRTGESAELAEARRRAQEAESTYADARHHVGVEFMAMVAAEGVGISEQGWPAIQNFFNLTEQELLAGLGGRNREHRRRSARKAREVMSLVSQSKGRGFQP